VAPVGIIANPAAAHDVRRISGYGSGVENQEKIRIIRRLLLGLQAVGVDQVLVMPDHYRLCQHAADTSALHLPVHELPLACANDETDSTRAAEHMVAVGCACIVTLGGDGTNRAVAMGSGTTPLLPISTGTNNVIPSPIEGTIAGLAAGVFARGLVPDPAPIRRTKRLEIVRASEIMESALVDIAISTEAFIGARAITDLTSVRQLWLTQAVPGCLGLSAIGAHLHPLSPAADEALALDLDPDGTATDVVTVLAPIAPGLIRQARVRACRVLPLGESVHINYHPCTLVLDGERTLRLPADSPPISIRVHWSGPCLLDPMAVLDHAVRLGFFQQQ
jgi:hypothetical protein